MSKFLRIITTAVIGVGLILLFLYLCVLNNVNKADIFNQPSYYVVQNYWYVFLAGCGCIAFSLISCFLSWHKSMDTKIEILPNAVAAQKDEVVFWLSGSSLDTRRQTSMPAETISEQQVAEKPNRTQSHTANDETIQSALSGRTVDDNAATEIDSEATVLEISSDTVLDKNLPTGISNDRIVLEKDIHNKENQPCEDNIKHLPKNKKILTVVFLCFATLIVFFVGYLFVDKPEHEAIETVSMSKPESTIIEATVASDYSENEYPVHIEFDGDSMSVNADYLTILVENERHLTVTISGLSLQDTYLTNLSTTEPYHTEYSWWFSMIGWVEYSVSTTSAAFNPGAEEEKSLEDMQHSVFALVSEHGEEYYSIIADAEMTHTDNTITWNFSIPEDYAFDFSEMKQFTLSVTDAPNDYSLYKTYIVETSDE